MEFDHRIAEARSDAVLMLSPEMRHNRSLGSESMLGFGKGKPGLISRPPAPSNCFSAGGEVMLGSYPKSKALCSCGEIAEMDSSIVRLKRRLGKDIECRSCRNQRIAREHEILDMHFSSQDEEMDR